MPRPLPEYLTPEMRDFLAANYERGMTEFAEDLGIKYNSLVEILKRPPSRSLTRFLEAAEEIGIEPEALYKVLLIKSPQERKIAFEKLLYVSEGEKFATILRDNRPTLSYIYRVIKGDAGQSIKHFYFPIAKKLGKRLKDILPILHSAA